MEKTTTTAVSYDLLNPATLANPYSLYARMREEDPIHFLEAGQFWVITRYKDVLELFRDPRISADRRELSAQMLGNLDLGIIKDYLAIVNDTMLLKDAPAHTAIRKIANQGFMAKFTERWRKITQAIVDRLIDQVQHKGQIEIIRDLAYILPAEVIAEIFGIPFEDRDKFQRWGIIINDFFGAPVGENIEEMAREANEAAANITQYFYQKIAEREKDPKEDVISLLIAGYEGGKLNRNEVAAQCLLIMNAGFVTTVEMIPNALNLLLTHPDQLQKLRENPALLESAVEECLRYDTSVPSTFRIATDDIAIGGKVIPKGHIVALSMAAANHDPQQFESPEVFDITRTNNKHVAFGFGAHLCLGAPLARVELAIALGTLLRRLPNLRFDEQNPAEVKAESVMFKGYNSMWLKFDSK